MKTLGYLEQWFEERGGLLMGNGEEQLLRRTIGGAAVDLDVPMTR
jgi:hypothetical protein